MCISFVNFILYRVERYYKSWNFLVFDMFFFEIKLIFQINSFNVFIFVNEYVRFFNVYKVSVNEIDKEFDFYEYCFFVCI